MIAPDASSDSSPARCRTGRLALAATAVCCGGMLGGMGMLRGGPQQLTHPAPSRGEEKGWFGSLLNKVWEQTVGERQKMGPKC